jgi:hypothetical protein
MWEVLVEHCDAIENGRIHVIIGVNKQITEDKLLSLQSIITPVSLMTCSGIGNGFQSVFYGMKF